MTIPQIEFKQGISAEFAFDTTGYPTLASGVTWEAALVSPQDGKRYKADKPTSTEPNIVLFKWPSGLDDRETIEGVANPNYGKLDPTEPHNGTAYMSVGTYNLEIYTSDHSDIGVLYERFRVVASNLTAKNAPSQEVSD